MLKFSVNASFYVPHISWMLVFINLLSRSFKFVFVTANFTCSCCCCCCCHVCALTLTEKRAFCFVGLVCRLRVYLKNSCWLYILVACTYFWRAYIARHESHCCYGLFPCLFDNGSLITIIIYFLV